MVELDKYLRKKKPIEPADLRMTGLGLHLLGKLGQYISLMYGVYHIIQENPDIRGRLELFEKKVSGRAIGARVLDPNNIPVTEKLDDVVRKDVEKELAKKEKKKLK